MTSASDVRVVSIDFGTAFSKAAAVIRYADRTRPLQPEVLAVGKQAGWPGDYFVPSAVFLDKRVIYFGAEALAVPLPPGREVLQSFKLLLGANELGGLLDSRPAKKIDPDSTFTHRDLIILYLAYFIDLMELSLDGVDLAAADGSSVMRYTRPGWFTSRTDRDHGEIVRLLQTGKDVLRIMGSGFWRTPLDYDRARAALDEARADIGLVVEAGVFEATAAASCYLQDDGPSRCFVILDMGAGTTDLGAYLFSATSAGAGKIIASRSTLTIAGDDIDRALMNLLIDQAVDARSVSARSLLWRSLIPDVRAHKKRLYETGELTLKRRDGSSLSCSLKQLGQSAEYRSIVKSISTAYRDLVNATAVEASRHDIKEIIGIAAGGGAALPFIQELVKTAKPKKRINYRSTRELPGWMQGMRDGEFVAKDFSQLAVVIGAVIAPSTLLIHSTAGAKLAAAAGEFEPVRETLSSAASTG
jgi:molecular chaperone DnaK (HSP70)